jgi:hypothetical protein
MEAQQLSLRCRAFGENRREIGGEDGLVEKNYMNAIVAFCMHDG